MTGAQDVAAYRPLSLAEQPDGEIGALVSRARAGRLVLYLGAGISIPPPSDGPRGDDVADRLRPVVAELLDVAVEDVDEPNLEALASRVQHEAGTRLAELQDRAADSWAFRDMLPNYAHEIVALLLREGLVRVASANWDCAVENAGRRMDVDIQGVSDTQARLRLASRALPMFKVHGCAKRPETLVLTREAVDKPQRWARAEVGTALLGGVVVFIGLGTVGAYVSESVAELVRIWVGDDDVTVKVVDLHGPSEAWVDVLADRAEEAGIAMGGEPFLDEMARAVALQALSRVEARARALHDDQCEPWSQAMLDGLRALRAALAGCTADALLRWWRDGVSSELDGKPFIFEHAGETSLLCVAQIIGLDGGTAQAGGEGETLTVRGAGGYLEIEHKPGALRSAVERRARDRIARRRQQGRYEPGVPVIVAIHGADGAFPGVDGKPDIAAADTTEPDIAASDDDAIIIKRAEDATNGRLAA